MDLESSWRTRELCAPAPKRAGQPKFVALNTRVATRSRNHSTSLIVSCHPPTSSPPTSPELTEITIKSAAVLQGVSALPQAV